MRRATLFLAAVALVGGLATLGFELFGPTYGTASASIDSSGVTTSTTGTASLVEVGVSGVTLFYFGLIALGFVIVFLGALLEYRAERSGRYLMLMGLVPPVGISSISFGLGLLWPATLVAVTATVSAFLGRQGAAAGTGRHRSWGFAVWTAGAVFGALATPAILVLGVPALLVVLVLVLLAAVPYRSLAFVAGTLTGGGAVYFTLLVIADRACREFDRAPNQGCTPPDLTGPLVQAVLLTFAGLALGIVELWRRRTNA